MNTTMKTKAYITPQIQIFNIEMKSHLLDMSVSEKEITNNNNNVGLTREQKNGGIGGGLWSDMENN